MGAVRDCWGSSGDAASMSNIHTFFSFLLIIGAFYPKVQVGKDQEKAQSEKDSHSKNRGGKKPN